MALVKLRYWPARGRRPAEWMEISFPGLSAQYLKTIRKDITVWHDTLNHNDGRKIGTWATSCVPQSEAMFFLSQHADRYADVIEAIQRDGVTAAELLYALTLTKGVVIEEREG